MSNRGRLPDRRQSEIASFLHEGRHYTASISRFADGSIAEIFLDVGKFGSDVSVSANESAILTSLALQCGVGEEVLKHAIHGPIRTALSLFAARH
jgi:hypothetical protein